MVHPKHTKHKKNGLHQNLIHRSPLQNHGRITHEKKKLKNNHHPNFIHSKKSTNFFPKIIPWLICFVVLIIRLNYVSQPKNWWILHPDEIFQSLEVAHSEVYGYGFRPYEYLPPLLQPEPKGRRQEINFGMFSLRSFLFPKFFILVSKLSHIFIGDIIHPFVIWKMCHTAVSSLLPMAVYLFTMTIYRSHDSSVLACVLVAFSVHISVFATHTLISSFLSPLVFFTLPPMLSIFQLDSEINDEDENKDCEHQEKSVITNENHSSVNYDHKKPCHNLFYKTHHYKIKNKKVSSTTKTVSQKQHHLFFCGFFIGIFIYIRFDLLIFYISLFLPLVIVHWYKFLSSFWKLILIVFGFCFGIFVAATDDYYSYNSFFISPYQWFMFNVFKDFSSTFFGRSDMGFYINHILLHNISMVTMFLATCLTLAISLVKQDILCQTQTKNTLCLLLSTTIMFISYTLKGHKEVRFLHNFIVLLMVIYSNTFITIWQYLQTRLSYLISKTATALLAILVLIFYIGHQWCIFPSTDSIGDWSYLNNQESGHANECLYYISQQQDVSGVFFDQSLHTSGAYSLLHLDVPILILIQREFYEFTHDSKIRIQRLHNWLANEKTPNDNVTIYVLCNVSNYVSVYNIQYLLKHLITHIEYNYVLLRKSRQFIQLGFKQVFESGSMQVLKRIGDPVSEKNLQIIAQNISPLSSFTSEKVAGDVLLHEAHFLYSYGQYKLAEERLSVVAHLKTPRVAFYQLLFNLYRKLGEENKANLYWKKCVEKFNQAACLKTVQITDLYVLSKTW